MATTSITLDEILKRLNTLESKVSSSGYKDKLLWSGATIGRVTLSEPVNNYDALIVNVDYNNTRQGGDLIFIPRVLYGTKIGTEFINSAMSGTIIATSNYIEMVYNWGNTSYITHVVGLKWGGAITLLLRSFLGKVIKYGRCQRNS